MRDRDISEFEDNSYKSSDLVELYLYGMDSLIKHLLDGLFVVIFFIKHLRSKRCNYILQEV